MLGTNRKLVNPPIRIKDYEPPVKRVPTADDLMESFKDLSFNHWGPDASPIALEFALRAGVDQPGRPGVSTGVYFAYHGLAQERITAVLDGLTEARYATAHDGAFEELAHEVSRTLFSNPEVYVDSRASHLRLLLQDAVSHPADRPGLDAVLWSVWGAPLGWLTSQFE